MNEKLYAGFPKAVPHIPRSREEWQEENSPAATGEPISKNEIDSDSIVGGGEVQSLWVADGLGFESEEYYESYMSAKYADPPNQTVHADHTDHTVHEPPLSSENTEKYDQTKEVNTSFQTVHEHQNQGPLGETVDRIDEWLARFIVTASDGDRHKLVLWAAHSHLVKETYTTPRLLIDSPVYGAGKTTVLDHLKQLCFEPVQAASLSSPAMVARLLEKRPRTILIDEADRTLNPKDEDTSQLLAVLNSGYRYGSTRPVLVPDTEGGWEAVEMSTFGPVAMAGNAPNLPEDTRSRCVTVTLFPDSEGRAEDSDWQLIEGEADQLGEQLAAWADGVREEVRTSRPEKPHGLRGRDWERWGPLYKVALAAGGEWPARCRDLIEADLEEQKMDREEGLMRKKRHVLLLEDIAEVWPEGVEHVPSAALLAGVKRLAAHRWTAEHTFGELTVQGMGKMLSKHFKVRTKQATTVGADGKRSRGYLKASFIPAWKALGIKTPD